ncbi:unnamed protein product [Cercospora beticola]|nr:unnamed protein product [Cercospora beticola]
MAKHAPGNVIDAGGLVKDPASGSFDQYTQDNLNAWNAIAGDWEVNQSPEVNGKADDGNDMFTQCLLPVVDELAEWKFGQTVLDLGAGSGIIARRFAKHGANVTGLDFSEAMLEKGRARSKSEHVVGSITYDFIDLMDYDGMAKYMADKDRFDVITISTTLKSLPDLQPLAKALPLMLKPTGRVVIVDLHPAFSKPAGHRGMEIFEDPKTGKQQLSTYIKVPRYLNIPPSKSEAVRGQPEPLVSDSLFYQPASYSHSAVGVSPTILGAYAALLRPRPCTRRNARASVPR